MSSSPRNAPLDVGPFEVSATVVHGFERGGKLLGTPTANLDPQQLETVPWMKLMKDGVYAGFARLGADPTWFSTVCSLGDNPHFRNTDRSLEVHLLGYTGPDFYEQTLHLTLVAWIRHMKSFTSTALLIESIAEDKKMAKRYLASVRMPQRTE
jgi:FAD synthase